MTLEELELRIELAAIQREAINVETESIAARLSQIEKANAQWKM